MKLYTVGHSDLTLSEFVAILQDHDIGWIADVRSTPFSGRFPHFNRSTLAEALKRSGIKYLYVGDQVGGKPPSNYVSNWAQGKLDYLLVSSLSESTKWREGIGLLSRTIVKEAARAGCLVCSEGDPNNCHRSLIAFELEQSVADLVVEHIGGRSIPPDVTFQKTLFKVPDDRSDYH